MHIVLMSDNSEPQFYVSLIYCNWARTCASLFQKGEGCLTRRLLVLFLVVYANFMRQRSAIKLDQGRTHYRSGGWASLEEHSGQEVSYLTLKLPYPLISHQQGDNTVVSRHLAAETWPGRENFKHSRALKEEKHGVP